MRRWSSLRVRLTLGCVALVVGLTTAVLAVSWDLMDRHLQRTLSPALADQVADELVQQYVLAIVGAAFLALALAWAGAGRLLRPVRAIAETARRVGEEDRLQDRVGPQTGPRDELHDLATSFDGMLDRVEGAVGAQRRFVANASHELRTPMTAIRAEAEVALDDPDATTEELRAALRGVVEAGEGAERLLDGLLVLAGATEGVPRRERVDMTLAVERALRSLGLARLPGRCEPATVLGDDLLLERVVANLVENAVVHGHDPELDLLNEDGHAVLIVRSAGSVLAPDFVDRLAEPFERGTRSRTLGRGAGLGLSIVRAVARAHGGSLALTPRPGGGLVCEVRLPVVDRAPGSAIDASGRGPVMSAGPRVVR